MRNSTQDAVVCSAGEVEQYGMDKATSQHIGVRCATLQGKFTRGSSHCKKEGTHLRAVQMLIGCGTACEP
jgi:hypothetical protein